MKRILLLTVLALSSAFAYADAATDFVQATMNELQQAVELPDPAGRVAGLCAGIGEKMAQDYVSNIWLADYQTLSRDQAGIDHFRSIIPSIIVTKLSAGIERAQGGRFEVANESTDKGNGSYVVGVTIYSRDGDEYSGEVVVRNETKWEVLDILYFGFSAVEYMGDDFQRKLNRFYDRDPKHSLPVTQLNQSIEEEDGFVRCP